jgi:hypothetical protein
VAGEQDKKELATIESVLANGLANLPEFLSQTAFGAISRLVTGLVDIPAVALAGYKERLEDKNREARSLRQSLSDAAIAKVLEDDLVVQRAVDRLINEQVKKQKNLEAVASGTIRILSERPATTSDEKLDEEWLDKFSEKAETAHSEAAQDIWARVLAGELAIPGSFSKRSLDLLKALDPSEAEKFANIVRLSFGNIIPSQSIGFSGRLFSDAIKLQDLGLLSGVSPRFSKPIMYNAGEKFGGLAGRRVHLQVYSNYQPQIDIVFLTEVGRQLAYLVDDPDAAAEWAVGQLIARSIEDVCTAAMLLKKDENGDLSEPETVFGDIIFDDDAGLFRILSE